MARRLDFLLMNSTIHKAAGLPAAVQNDLWRPFCTAVPHRHFSVLQGMASNEGTGGFVNSAGRSSGFVCRWDLSCDLNSSVRGRVSSSR